MAESHRIVRAWLESPTTGIIELDRDWTRRAPPRFTLGPHCPAPGALAPALGRAALQAYGYYLTEGGEICFGFPAGDEAALDPATDRVFLAGDFNGWQAAIGQEEWELQPAELDGGTVWWWTGDPVRFLTAGGHRFKFVTAEHQWLLPPPEAPNTARDAGGNVNRLLDPDRTGWHLWRFTLGRALDLAEPWTAGWADGTGGTAPVVPGGFFFQLRSDLPLGALVRGAETCFRLFAPRARAVTLWIAREVTELEQALSFPLERRPDADGAAGVWEVALDRNLHGWFYWYTLDGRHAGFDAAQRVLDPYSRAAVGRDGPGIVLDAAWVGQGDRGFRTPAWHDLIIAEAHVRDLAEHAPVAATAEERRGFTGLRRWVESEAFYLAQLGVNCVELQPLQEFDNVTAAEYHWGYMPNNYFAPESAYALDPERASGVRELQELVAALHRRGLAVIVDVVYNHVGVPAHLQAIDQLYYFEQDAQGVLTNWSGCGNDLRARSAMTRRLIIDSCVHWIEAFGVDGFRFDLAELLGVEVLRDLEAALKRVKPDVILIAEPWSFRGHIAGALRDSGWASWNDGFRDFVRDYVRGNGDAARLEYFLRGSPWYFAKWPAQTVNYTESHDDRTWIDAVSERGDGNGFHPTEHDRRRTHLMAALLFMSVGVPMLSAGQDFLRSKHGVANTYLRGDLNALDYRRLHRFISTHTYFADWIAFRRGDLGRLLRHWRRPGEGFFRFYHGFGAPALAVVVNADRSQGRARLLFAINPTLGDVTLILDAATLGGAGGRWEMLADQDRFYLADAHGARRPVEERLWLPALSCALWVSRE
jgi:pullulanase